MVLLSVSQHLSNYIPLFVYVSAMKPFSVLFYILF